MDVVQRRRFRDFVALSIVSLYLWGVLLVGIAQGADVQQAIGPVAFLSAFMGAAYKFRPRPMDRRVVMPIVTGSLLLLAATLAARLVLAVGGDPYFTLIAGLVVLALAVLVVRQQVLKVTGPSSRPTTWRSAHLEVMVEGAGWHARKRAQRELVDFYSPLVRNAGNFDVRVWIPRSFEQAMDETVYRGQGVKIHFVAQQPHLRVGGSTIPILSKGSLAFVIIFSPTLINGLMFGRRKSRWYFYAHEGAHLLDYAEIYRRVGLSNFFSHPADIGEFLFHWAQGMLAEYRAERWAIGTINEMIPRGDVITRIAFDAEAGRLTSALEDLPSFLSHTAQYVGDRVMTLREFTRSVSPRIWELFTLAAYVAGQSDGLLWDAKFLADLRDKPDYRFFFDAWGDILPKLRSLAPPSEGYDVDRLREIAKLLLSFCEVCGLEFREVATTFYVGIKAPDFERFAHPTGEQLLRQEILRLEEIGRSDARTHRARVHAEQRLVELSLDPNLPSWARKSAQDAIDRIRPLIHSRRAKGRSEDR